MNSIEKEDKTQINNTINNESQSQAIKIKKKKKKSKKVKEKKCNGLKELLEQIKEEKLEKSKKEQEKLKEKNLNLDINKKEEPLLISGVPSPTENEDKNKDYIIKDNLNIINSSVSGTTVATLSHDDINEFQKFNFDKYSDCSNKFEYNDLKPNFLMKNYEISEDEKIEDEQQFHNKRKISSPICDYYCGFDKILSETHKGSVDLTNSMNFIKKEDLISNKCMINNPNTNNNDLNYYINSEANYKLNNNNIDIDYNNSNNIINENNIDNMTNDNNFNDNHFNDNKLNYNELNQIDIDMNIINNNIDKYNYMNVPYSQYMDYYNFMPESFINSKFNIGDEINNINYNNKNKYKNRKNKRDKNKLKNDVNYNKKRDNLLAVRDGDWLCQFCLNLNFSFRTFCNRCKAPK